MMENFEKSTKPTFKSITERSFIKFGSVRDKDPAVGIRSGQLPIEGSAQSIAVVGVTFPNITWEIRHEIAQLFEPSVKAIVQATRKQCLEATSSVSVRNILSL